MLREDNNKHTCYLSTIIFAGTPDPHARVTIHNLLPINPLQEDRAIDAAC